MIGILKLVEEKIKNRDLFNPEPPLPDRLIVIGSVPDNMLGKIMMVCKFDEEVNQYYYAGIRIYP